MHARIVAALALLPAVARAGELEEKLEAKLKEPFLGNAEWVGDYGAALAKAKKERKIVFAYFTRSYYP